MASAHLAAAPALACHHKFLCEHMRHECKHESKCQCGVEVECEECMDVMGDWSDVELGEREEELRDEQLANACARMNIAARYLY